MKKLLIPVIVSILILGISITEDAFATIITETQKVFPGGEFINDFGASVSIDGNTAVVGTIFDFIQDPPGTFFDTGAAYIYERNSEGVWIQVQVIRPSGNPDDAQFGNSVAISGDTIVVGAHFEGNFHPGAAYIFEKTGGVWPATETKRILASDIVDGDNFGTSVDISGDTVIVGSFTDIVFDFGGAYIFEKTGGVWPATETKKISASDDANSDSFGESVSIDGNTIVVGSPSDDTVLKNGVGAAYIFEKTGGVWPDTETKIIIASDRAEFDNFGISVSISGDTVIVGADFEDVKGSASGSAYIFEKNAGVWPTTETKKIFASDGTSSDNFGTSVSISGDIAIAGSPTADGISGFQDGVVYAFEKNAGVWPMTESHKLQGSTETEGDDFGTSVSISGGNVIVGLPDDDILITDNSGSAYFFELELGADLSLVKTFEPDVISPGVTFSYFLTVKNNGPAEAVNVVVTDELPSEAPLDTTFIDVTPGPPVCTFSSGKITCNLGNMVKDDEKIIEIVVKAHDEAPRGGFILNDATVKSDTDDPNPLNDEGNALIEIEIEGDLKLFAPDDSEILETLEEFPGGMVVVNDDNDNTDGSFDLNDVGNTNNEDELVKLEIAKLTAPKGELYLNGNLGTEVAVYKTSDRTDKITSFPVEVSESDVFFIEGLKPSIFTQVNFELTPLNQPLESLDLVRLTVIKIESITFSGNGNSFAKDDNLDFNINPATGNTLGERVFPGSRLEGSPLAVIGPFGSKDKVTVTVELSSIVPFETKVFLKSFDVDDPGANMAPIDPNHDALGGTMGDYRNADPNPPSPPQYSSSVFPARNTATTLISYLTDEDNRGSVNGKKSGELLEHFDDTDGDGTLDPGEILFDVQGINGNQSLDKEDANGIITMIIGGGEKSNFVDLQVTRQPGDNFKVVASFDEDFLNQLRNTDGIDGLEIFEKFVNAKLLNEKMSSDVLTVWRILHLEIDSMGAPHPIVKFDGAGVGNDDVGPKQAGAAAIFDLTGAVKQPDTSLLNPTLNTQYIFVNTIPEVSGLDETDKLTFTKNLPVSLMNKAGAVVRDVPSAPTFWAVHIIGAYEGPTSKDNDPTAESALLGRAKDSSLEKPTTIFMFLETIRDLHADQNPVGTTVTQVLQRSTVHEVGHSLSLRHSGDIMGKNYNPDNPIYPRPSLTFSNAQQSAERSLDRP